MSHAREASPARFPTWFRVLRVLVIVAGVVVGLGMMLVAFALGDCSAFGGRCPREPEPILEDDVFWFAGFGAALAVAPSVYLSRPSWRRLGAALAVAAVAVLVVGSLARASTNG